MPLSLCALRILFASTRGAGHFNPLVSFIESALREGHEILVAGPPPLAETTERAGYPFWPCDAPPEDVLGPTWARVQTASSEEAEAIVVGEIFGTLNVQAALPRMRSACEEWRPDLIMRDPAEFASAIAAEACAIPHARGAVGLASSERHLTEVASPSIEARSPGITKAIVGSPYLTMFPATLDRPDAGSPPHTRRFRDPATDTAPAALGDWWPGDDRPLIYLTFGSVAGSLQRAPALFRSALEAAGQIPARVLLTTGKEVAPEALGPPPANVHLTQWVPQADAFAEASLVVCHGGSGTTLGALAAGLPLVIVPLFADQPANAKRVAEVGAGLVVEPLREGATRALPSSIDPGALRDAILAGLQDLALAGRVKAIAEEMRALPPMDGALESLVAGSSH